MKEFWSRRIREMVPYVPGEQPKGRKFIKLNTNENPYPPSERVMEVIKSVKADTLRLYPDPECMELREAIAEHYGIKAGNVFCGNGSDEVLSFAFQAFFDKEKPVVFPDITYSFYEVYVKYLDLTAKIEPLNEDFSLPVEKFFRTPGGTVIANPNAPTGQAVSGEVICRILEENPENVVIVDEAYVDFGGESAAKLIGAYPNLLVVQTASKSRSLAGLRVGWAMGDENLIAGLQCVRDSINSYTVDWLAMAAATAAVRDREYWARCCGAVCRTRETTREWLMELGFEAGKSEANFLFIRHPKVSGKTLFAGLRQAGILVRRWDLPRIEEYLRVSIGTEEEMKTFCGTMEALLAKEEGK